MEEEVWLWAAQLVGGPPCSATQGWAGQICPSPEPPELGLSPLFPGDGLALFQSIRARRPLSRKLRLKVVTGQARRKEWQPPALQQRVPGEGGGVRRGPACPLPIPVSPLLAPAGHAQDSHSS